MKSHISPYGAPQAGLPREKAVTERSKFLRPGPTLFPFVAEDEKNETRTVPRCSTRFQDRRLGLPANSFSARYFLPQKFGDALTQDAGT